MHDEHDKFKSKLRSWAKHSISRTDSQSGVGAVCGRYDEDRYRTRITYLARNRVVLAEKDCRTSISGISIKTSNKG
jgi:hypothetical protein